MPTSGYWPEKTRCRLGGYGAGRTEGSLARAQQSGTSTAKTKRTFHTEQDIVAALRASLSAFEDDDGVRLTPPEVDRTLVGVVELAPEAPHVCHACWSRVFQAALVDGAATIRRRAATVETPAPPVPMQIDAPTADPALPCALLDILGGTQELGMVMQELTQLDPDGDEVVNSFILCGAARFGVTCKVAHSHWCDRVKADNLMWLEDVGRLTRNIGQLQRANRDLIRSRGGFKELSIRERGPAGV